MVVKHRFHHIGDFLSQFTFHRWTVLGCPCWGKTWNLYSPIHSISTAPGCNERKRKSFKEDWDQTFLMWLPWDKMSRKWEYMSLKDNREQFWFGTQITFQCIPLLRDHLSFFCSTRGAVADAAGAPAARPPRGSRFFRFDILILQNVAASGVGAPCEVGAPTYEKSWIRQQGGLWRQVLLYISCIWVHNVSQWEIHVKRDGTDTI